MIFATPTGRNGSKLAPRQPQETPKTAQEAPKTAQETPRRPQEGALRGDPVALGLFGEPPH